MTQKLTLLLFTLFMVHSVFAFVLPSPEKVSSHPGVGHSNKVSQSSQANHFQFEKSISCHQKAFNATYSWGLLIGFIVLILLFARRIYQAHKEHRLKEDWIEYSFKEGILKIKADTILFILILVVLYYLHSIYSMGF